jgi:hypothetical protein
VRHEILDASIQLPPINLEECGSPIANHGGGDSLKDLMHHWGYLDIELLPPVAELERELRGGKL